MIRLTQANDRRPPGVLWKSAMNYSPSPPPPPPPGARTHWKPHACPGCGAPAVTGALHCAYCRRPS